VTNEHLATYLNDHLAGSVAALEVLEKLQAAYEGTELEQFCAELRNDIEADRQAQTAHGPTRDTAERPA
jgi:hypothetical protein